MIAVAVNESLTESKDSIFDFDSTDVMYYVSCVWFKYNCMICFKQTCITWIVNGGDIICSSIKFAIGSLWQNILWFWVYKTLLSVTILKIEYFLFVMEYSCKWCLQIQTVSIASRCLSTETDRDLLALGHFTYICLWRLLILEKLWWM